MHPATDWRYSNGAPRETGAACSDVGPSCSLRRAPGPGRAWAERINNPALRESRIHESRSLLVRLRIARSLSAWERMRRRGMTAAHPAAEGWRAAAMVVRGRPRMLTKESHMSKVGEFVNCHRASAGLLVAASLLAPACAVDAPTATGDAPIAELALAGGVPVSFYEPRPGALAVSETAPAGVQPPPHSRAVELYASLAPGRPV